MDKKRLDVHMVEAGLAPSRERARAMIMAGEVFVNGQKAEKAGVEVRPDDVVTIQEDPIPFVSRGGLKLDKALKGFPLTLKDKVCLDVGYGQLDWKLRNDHRVTVMERRNARYMEPEWFDGLFDFASIDVSFISLKLILPPLKACLKPDGQVVALIKPQFEAGRGQVGKNGVVREASIHNDVCINIIRFAQQSGYSAEDLSFSPITGPKGNIEFLLFLRNEGETRPVEVDAWAEKTARIVSDGHKFHINC